MRKKTVGMLLGMVMALSLTAGCGGQSQENHNDTAGETGTQEQTAQETEESQDQEGGGFPHKLVHHAAERGPDCKGEAVSPCSRQLALTQTHV